MTQRLPVLLGAMLGELLRALLWRELVSRHQPPPPAGKAKAKPAKLPARKIRKGKRPQERLTREHKL